MSEEEIHDGQQRMKAMTDLARSFPGLQRALGIEPWDAAKLDIWACCPAPNNQARHTARFVLSVWNHQFEWRCGWFDIHLALSKWDDKHRKAFADWAVKPHWP